MSSVFQPWFDLELAFTSTATWNTAQMLLFTAEDLFEAVCDCDIPTTSFRSQVTEFAVDQALNHTIKQNMTTFLSFQPIYFDEALKILNYFETKDWITQLNSELFDSWGEYTNITATIIQHPKLVMQQTSAAPSITAGLYMLVVNVLTINFVHNT